MQKINGFQNRPRILIIGIQSKIFKCKNENDDAFDAITARHSW